MSYNKKNKSMSSTETITWQATGIKLACLKEYPNNPRKISKEMLDKLASHIKEDGYHQRIIVDNDYTIIGGHQRKKALYMAGYDDETEIEVLMPSRKLTPEEIDRLNIRDNLAFGEYDFDVLTERFDMDELLSFGMDKDMLAPVFDKAILEEIVEEENIEVEVEAIARLGDIYLLGSHRLMCGDSTNPQHVEKLMDGASPILMVTDPPYGVNYEPEWRNEVGKGTRNTGKVLNDDRYDWSDAYSLFTGDVAYVWHSSKYTHKFAENIENCGFDLVSLIIWNKPHFAISRGDYHHKHEPLWYAVRKGQKVRHNWQGRRDQTTVWDIDNALTQGIDKEEQTGHGTQKPMECMLRPILNNSAPGQSVYDPFGGSGTTLIACERSKRNCYMMELSPAYVDVIIKRWEKESNKKAVLLNE
ncbi:MAG: DNA modification methylase [Alphaproteobacteria bacterium]|nr:DNA modification methylase [Alphaproteobacteria bacterium]